MTKIRRTRFNYWTKRIVCLIVKSMNTNKFILTAFAAVIGLMMIISPATFISMIVIILGVAAVVDGIFIMATTRNLILDPQYKTMMTVRGILSIVVGALSILLPLVIASLVYNVMAYVLAVYLLVSAVLQSYGISKLHRNGIMIRQSVIELLLSVLLAVVLFIIPAKTAGSIIVRIAGIAILAVGIFSGISQWRDRAITVTSEVTDDYEDAEEETETAEQPSEPQN